MARNGRTKEDILRVLREAESDETVVEVCHMRGISQQSFYLWKKKCAGLGLSERGNHGSFGGSSKSNSCF